MILRKTMASFRGIYRIFEAGHDVFHVLNENGRTVDQFELVPSTNSGGVATCRPFRRTPLARGVPDFARRIASEMNRLRPSG